MDAPTCRFCFEESSDTNLLISPCRCVGSIQYLHTSCLLKWQRMAPAQFVRRCQLCLTNYTTLAGVLEVIPNERGILYQFLGCPYLFTFSSKYFLFIYSGLLTTRYEHVMNIIDIYQIGLHIFYFVCFLQVAQVNNRHLYMKQFFKTHRLAMYICHFFFYYIGTSSQNVFILYLVDIFLPLYWHFHMRSLEEINRLLA